MLKKTLCTILCAGMLLTITPTTKPISTKETLCYAGFIGALASSYYAGKQIGKYYQAKRKINRLAAQADALLKDNKAVIIKVTSTTTVTVTKNSDNDILVFTINSSSNSKEQQAQTYEVIRYVTQVYNRKKCISDILEKILTNQKILAVENKLAQDIVTHLEQDKTFTAQCNKASIEATNKCFTCTKPFNVNGKKAGTRKSTYSRPENLSNKVYAQEIINFANDRENYFDNMQRASNEEANRLFNHSNNFFDTMSKMSNIMKLDWNK